MLPAILALAQLAPSIMGLFTRDDTATKAAGIVSTVAKTITGANTDEGALETLKANPAMLIEYQKAINAHALGMYQEETKRLETVNATIRAEYTSCDPYVRRARPTFIYAMAASWTFQMAAISVAMVWKPEQAGPLITAATGLTTMWGVALAVIGVAVHKRTQDKQIAAGIAPTGPMDALKGIFKR